MKPSLLSHNTLTLHMVPPTKQQTVAEIEAESEELRKEIAVLRKEAKSRLEKLSEQLDSISSSSLDMSEDDLLPAPVPIVFTETKKEKKKKSKSIANLLDETTWKISLSIGREPNTWMAKEWGKSGKRLNISFNCEFTPSQLFDRDDFFRGGYANSKILHIVDNEIKLGPSISEGQRVYKVKDGGWQVTQGDGPMGTDLLRFYIEIDEEIAHKDGDVYVPKGRVYCSCGYFPFTMKSQSSVKEAYMKELQSIDEKVGQLQKKKDEINNPFSLEGFNIGRDIGKLMRQADAISTKMFNLSVTEPDRKLLKFTRDGDVGLTKEGGVCCRVQKGPVTEYHILGRFSSACIDEE